MDSLEIVLQYQSFPKASELWSLLCTTHPQLLDNDIIDGYTEKKLKFSDFDRYLYDHKSDSFNVKLNSGSFRFGDSGGHKYARLAIDKIILGEADAEEWLEPLLKDKRFIQARLYDDEYNKWQNMDDPKYYESEGRSYEGLPMKSNGLPFPLEQQVIDISENPGRKEFKQGYIEFVGSVMWLGEQFWNNTGTDKAAVLSADWLKTEEVDDVVKLKAMDAPFTTAEGKLGELQNKLRLLLYQNS